MKIYGGCSAHFFVFCQLNVKVYLYEDSFVKSFGTTAFSSVKLIHKDPPSPVRSVHNKFQRWPVEIQRNGFYSGTTIYLHEGLMSLTYLLI